MLVADTALWYSRVRTKYKTSYFQHKS